MRVSGLGQPLRLLLWRLGCRPLVRRALFPQLLSAPFLRNRKEKKRPQETFVPCTKPWSADASRSPCRHVRGVPSSWDLNWEQGKNLTEAHHVPCLQDSGVFRGKWDQKSSQMKRRLPDLRVRGRNSSPELRAPQPPLTAPQSPLAVAAQGTRVTWTEFAGQDDKSHLAPSARDGRSSRPANGHC